MRGYSARHHAPQAHSGPIFLRLKLIPRRVRPDAYGEKQVSFFSPYIGESPQLRALPSGLVETSGGQEPPPLTSHTVFPRQEDPRLGSLVFDLRPILVSNCDRNL